MEYKYIVAILLGALLFDVALSISPGSSCDSPNVHTWDGVTWPQTVSGSLYTDSTAQGYWSNNIRLDADTSSGCNSAVSAGGVYWVKFTVAAQQNLYVTLTYPGSTTDFDALYVVADGPNACPQETAESYPDTFRCLVNSATSANDVCQGYPASQPSAFTALPGVSYFIGIIKKKTGDASLGTTFSLRVDVSGSLDTETFETGLLPTGNHFRSICVLKTRLGPFPRNRFFRMAFWNSR